MSILKRRPGSSCDCNNAVIDCVAGCGFWIPGQYTGDFITQFDITPGTLDITASKDDEIKRTSDAGTFRVPTDLGDYTIKYQPNSFPRRWDITGPGIPLTSDARAYYELNDYGYDDYDCELNGSIEVRDGSVSGDVLFTLDMQMLVEVCPDCCGNEFEGDAYQCTFKPDAVKRVYYELGDINSPSSGVYTRYESTGELSWKPVREQHCLFYFMVHAIETFYPEGYVGDQPDPNVTWLSAAWYDPSAGLWRLLITSSELSPGPTQAGNYFQILTTPFDAGNPCAGGYIDWRSVEPSGVIQYVELEADGYFNCEFPPEPWGAMALDLLNTLPDAFSGGCGGCKDILRLLNSYTPAEASDRIAILTTELYRVTQLSHQPPAVKALSQAECQTILEGVIARAS